MPASQERDISATGASAEENEEDAWPAGVKGITMRGQGQVGVQEGET